jgi:Xaa-Pro aminopeptidase
MRRGEVVVMDVGASFGGYAADVTRTVPVSGRFSPEQRAVYPSCARRSGPPSGRPGRRAVGRPRRRRPTRWWRAGWRASGSSRRADAEFDAPWATQCTATPRLCKQYALFLPHGLGHGIGLEVHDPAMYYFDDRTLRDGDVFTIEPGVYVNPTCSDCSPTRRATARCCARIRPAVERYAHVGVRIEDDFWSRRAGLERLSRAPREADEIEAAMARARGVVP